MKFRDSTIATATIVITIVSGSVASGEPLPIVNPSFEDISRPLDPGEQTNGSGGAGVLVATRTPFGNPLPSWANPVEVAGWRTRLVPQGSTDEILAGVLNPPLIDGQPFITGQDGKNVFAIQASQVGQTINAQIQPNTRYRLDFIGGIGITDSEYCLSPTFIAVDDLTTLPLENFPGVTRLGNMQGGCIDVPLNTFGTMQPYSLEYTTPPVLPPELVGKYIGIHMYGSDGVPRVVYDDFHLDATPVSEPGGLAIIAHQTDASIDGEEFSGFGGPVLNDASQVTFVARIGTAAANADTGIFLTNEDGLTLLAREGSQMTGINNRFHDDFLNAESRAELAMNNVGQVAFWTRDQSDNSWEAIYAWDGNRLLAQTFTNSGAPNGVGNLVAFNRSLGIAEFGGVIFHAEIDIAGVTEFGIFIQSAIFLGQSVRLVRTGDPEFPSQNPIVLCGINSTCGATFGFNAFGQISNYAFTQNPELRSRIHRIFAGGQPFPVGSEFGNWDFSGLFLMGLRLDSSVNDQFEVAFAGRVGGGSFSTSPSVILRKRNKAVIGATQVALTDDPAPDGNGVLADLRHPVINNASQVAFKSTFWQTNDSPNDLSGILLSTDDVPAIVAREGDFAPGGGIFSPLGGAPFALSHSGLVAYQADLHGLPLQQQAIFLSDGTETLEVARTGSPLLGSTIESIEFVGGNARQRTGLNDHGQVAYRAALANNLEAVVLYTPDARWRTDVSGSWDDAENWMLSIQPAFVHDTIVNSQTQVTIAGPASDAAVNNLTIGPGPVDITLPADSHIQCNGTFTLSDAAKLILEIDEPTPPGPSRFNVTGDAMLSGQFEIIAIDGFVPIPGHAFDVISTDTGTIQGQVGDVQGAFPYVVHYTPTSMDVIILPRARDLDTLVGFNACADGAEVSPDPNGSLTTAGCLTAFDADDDGDVDLADFGNLQAFFAGN